MLRDLATARKPRRGNLLVHYLLLPTLHVDV